METNNIAGVMPECQCFRSDSSDDVIAKAYVGHRDGILRYIHSAINNRAEAEDLTQDVFLRILDYRMLINEATIKFFMYKIARNLICDYLRRHQVRQECYDYMYYNVSS
ncbi:RNA polymerase sigma factor, partial [uncultured Muribaculum sp.]